MTRTERQLLLQLVEALFEGTATAAELSQLEQLVLNDQAARRLYVEAIDLHGQLAWDAAGLGSEEGVVTEPVRVQRTSARRRAVSIAASTIAVVLLLLVVVVWPRQPRHQEQMIARQDPPAMPQPVATPQEAPVVRPEIPEITLPSMNVPVNGSDLASGALPVVPVEKSFNRPQQEPKSDLELVAFINQEIRQSQVDASVVAAKNAKDDEWVRRVYLDLTGRIPTPSEAEIFIKDQRPQKRAELVDRLLASPNFAQHQATVWTNLLVGRSRDQEIDRGQLLAWLAHQFSTNRPWQETVEELVAAVGTESNGPANFLLAHMNNQAVPATAIASRILLCQQLQCSQCHEHPAVKEWRQSQFWELNAFFQQTKIRDSRRYDAQSKRNVQTRELVNVDEFGPTFFETLRGVVEVAYPRYGGVEVSTKQQTPLREDLARLLFTDDCPQAARAFVNRTWSQMFGYGFTVPVDDMGPHTPVSHPELLEQLSRSFVESGYDVKRLVRWICLSDAYQRSSQLPPRQQGDHPEQGDLPLFARMYLKPMTAEQLYDSLLIAAGTGPEALLQSETAVKRERWLSQFYMAVETEENGESSTFDGTLPQALMMMNGELVANAASLESNRLLQDLTGRRGLSETELIRQLSLAALSRDPSPEEMSQMRELLRRSVWLRTQRNVPPQLAMAEGLTDLYWAYLNSSEFVVNH